MRQSGLFSDWLVFKLAWSSPIRLPKAAPLWQNSGSQFSLRPSELLSVIIQPLVCRYKGYMDYRSDRLIVFVLAPLVVVFHTSNDNMCRGKLVWCSWKIRISTRKKTLKCRYIYNSWYIIFKYAMMKRMYKNKCCWLWNAGKLKWVWWMVGEESCCSKQLCIWNAAFKLWRRTLSGENKPLFK